MKIGRPWSDQNADEQEPSSDESEYHVRKCEDKEREEVDFGLWSVDSTLNNILYLDMHFAINVCLRSLEIR